MVVKVDAYVKPDNKIVRTGYALVDDKKEQDRFQVDR